MSPQIVVDEHLHHEKVTKALENWITAEQIGVELGGFKGRSDERIIPALRALKRRTFVTIDDWFYQSELCDQAYCLVYFALSLDRQAEIPNLLRQLFRLPGFRTMRDRLGKVVRVSAEEVRYYERRVKGERTVAWPIPRSRQR
jgi:hypothetical protein